MTKSQIEALLIESGEAGDMEQVAICKAALDGDPSAIDECAKVIANALAQPR
jgi:hypothetical protein